MIIEHPFQVVFSGSYKRVFIGALIALLVTTLCGCPKSNNSQGPSTTAPSAAVTSEKSEALRYLNKQKVIVARWDYLGKQTNEYADEVVDFKMRLGPKKGRLNTGRMSAMNIKNEELLKSYQSLQRELESLSFEGVEGIVTATQLSLSNIIRQSSEFHLIHREFLDTVNELKEVLKPYEDLGDPLSALLIDALKGVAGDLDNATRTIKLVIESESVQTKIETLCNRIVGYGDRHRKCVEKLRDAVYEWNTNYTQLIEYFTRLGLVDP